MMLDDDNIEDLDPAALDDHDGAEEEQEDEDEYDESSGEENIEDSVQADMDKLQRDFPGFHDKYRLIKRIGEGASPTDLKREHAILTTPRHILYCLQGGRPPLRPLR